MKFKGLLGLLGLCCCASVQAAADLTIWYGHEHSDLFHQQVEAFAKQEKVTIEVIDYYPAQLKSALLSGDFATQPPAMVVVPSDFIGMSRQLALQPLPANWPSSGNDVWHDGERYGLPLTMGNHLMLFYNTEYVIEPITAWEQLAEQASKLTAGVKPINWMAIEPYWFMPFLSAFDAWPLNTDGELTLDTPAMHQALSFYQQTTQQWPHLNDKECLQPCLEQGFIDGEWAYHIGGDWNLTTFQDALGDKLGVTVLPTLGGKRIKPLSGSYVMAMRHHDPANSQVLQRLVEMLYGEQYQVAQFEKHNLLPGNAKTRETLINRGISQQLAGSMAQLEHTRPMPTDDSMSIVWVAVGKGLDRLLHHQYSAAESARYMQRIADRELRRNR